MTLLVRMLSPPGTEGFQDVQPHEVDGYRARGWLRAGLCGWSSARPAATSVASGQCFIDLTRGECLVSNGRQWLDGHARPVPDLQ